MTRKATLVAVVALLALGTSAALAFGAAPGATGDAAMAQDTTTAEETTAMGQETTMAEAANVTFEDQTSNGSAVVVDEVVVPEGGFVVIHAAEEATEDPAQNETEFEGVTQTETEMDTAMVTETEMDGAMAQQYAAGEVLGNSTYLEPGTHENVTVTLDVPIEEDQVLIAMPHLDTNDNQLYEFPEADDPYTDDAGAVTDWGEVTVEEDVAETTMADDGDEEDGETTTE
ncbi:DUF7282 domain-containing protein [Halorussus litoreus]|uniref:DUF7282 domain-containing protein n=1 Tax=Halorussus litoreus TaxID=1710536 RepID=UPI000E26B72B|nr:hypothetical protein [Halorussus litoreus]